MAQAQLASRRGRKAVLTAKATLDDALAVCKQAEQAPDAVGGSSFHETEGPDAAVAPVSVQTYALTSTSKGCDVQGSSANNEVPSEKNQKQSSHKTWGDRANAEAGVVHSKSDSITTDVLVADGQSVKAGSSGAGTYSDRGELSSSTAIGTVPQENLGDVQGHAVLAISDTGKGKKLLGKGRCVGDRGLAAPDLKSTRQQGNSTCYHTLSSQYNSVAGQVG